MLGGYGDYDSRTKRSVKPSSAHSIGGLVSAPGTCDQCSLLASASARAHNASCSGIYAVMPLVIIMGAVVVEYMQLRVVYSVGQVLRMAINIATAMALFPSTAAPAFAIKASLTLDSIDSMDDHAVNEVYAAL